MIRIAEPHTDLAIRLVASRHIFTILPVCFRQIFNIAYLLGDLPETFDIVII